MNRVTEAYLRRAPGAAAGWPPWAPRAVVNASTGTTFTSVFSFPEE